MKKPIDKEFFRLMNQVYEAKRSYYAGDPIISDYQYDGLEAAIIMHYGSDAFYEWYCVGYDSNAHQKLNEAFSELYKGII